MSQYAARGPKQKSHENRSDRAGVMSCITQRERSEAADKLRALGFKRLFFFNTLGGFYCVEGLSNDDRPSSIPDDQAGD
jgi:hypothetical protein